MNPCNTVIVNYNTSKRVKLFLILVRPSPRIARCPREECTYRKKMDSNVHLGVAAVEDKIVQQAVVTILNQIYEEDFLGFSYGFRPGRSQHDALDALSYALLKKKVNYILDADIRGFFDNLDKRWLVKFVEHRVADPRILRLIQKWLKAGVMEEGKWSEPKTGSPQGSVISPLLAKFGLELHPDKTRRIEFGRFAEENRKRRGEGKPETFDFLGFKHISGKNGNGSYAVQRMTVRKRMRKKLQEIKQQLRMRMHDPVFFFSSRRRHTRFDCDWSSDVCSSD